MRSNGFNYKRHLAIKPKNSRIQTVYNCWDFHTSQVKLSGASLRCNPSLPGQQLVSTRAHRPQLLHLIYALPLPSTCSAKQPCTDFWDKILRVLVPGLHLYLLYDDYGGGKYFCYNSCNKNNKINEKYIKILQIYHKIIVIIFGRWLQHIIESNDIFVSPL